MITDKIIEKIEELRHNTTTAIQQVQESKVPAIYKMKAEIQQTYFMDGMEYVYNGGKLIILIKNLPIYYNLQRNVFEDSMINMVNNKEIKPFLIFVNGKFVKWSDIKLVHDFKERYIIINNFDLSRCYVSANRTTSMRDMYNNWERFSHDIYGKFPANQTELSGWGYDTATDSVKCTTDSNTYVGFISDKKYSNYIHQLTIRSNASDGDIISTVIAYHKDEAGREHTLSAIRCIDTSKDTNLIGDVGTKWAIVYNLNQSNEKLIANGNNKIVSYPSNTTWKDIPRGFTIKVERTDNMLVAVTSHFNSNILDNNTLLMVDLDSDPVLAMFKGAKQYGYGCLSQEGATFTDISFIDLKDNIILPEVEMVTLPFNIVYNEGQLSLSEYNIFAFDESGLCVDSINGPVSTVDLNDPYIYYESKYLTPERIQATDINPEYKISRINPLLFRNGKLYSGAQVSFYGLNTFLVDNGNYESNQIKYKLFYYIYGNESKDNILNIINKQAAISSMTSGTDIPSHLANFYQDFDFQFDKNMSYSDNISVALKYIMFYNPALLNDIYKDINKIKVREYTGSYILGLADSSGYVTMSRGNKGRLLNYVIILVNGKLYKYYHHLKYKGNNFTFPIMDIKSTDTIEVIVFQDIDNRILEGKLSSEQPNEYYLDSNIDINDLRIFSRDAYNRTFDVPNTDYLRYSVDFKAERIDEARINITLKDSYYYDRKLYFASARQFRYYYEIIKEAKNNITLPEEFAYCKNKNNYMIFINGRKIDTVDFQFTKVDINVPFEDLSLYLRIPLKKGDKVDIFYVPEEMIEVITLNSIPSSGDIYVDRSKLPYAFDTDLYFVFMNGKKVNKNNIITINSHKAKIKNNIGTVYNLSIIKHVKDEDVIKKLFYNNVYDDATDNMTDAQINTLFTTGKIINTETNIKRDIVQNDEITKQIINDYFLRTITTKVNSDDIPNIITYDYSEKIPLDFNEKDSDGNILIK